MKTKFKRLTKSVLLKLRCSSLEVSNCDLKVQFSEFTSKTFFMPTKKGVVTKVVPVSDSTWVDSGWVVNPVETARVGAMKYFRVKVGKKIRSHDRAGAGVQNKIRIHDATRVRFRNVVSTVYPATVLDKKDFPDS